MLDIKYTFLTLSLLSLDSYCFFVQCWFRTDSFDTKPELDSACISFSTMFWSTKSRYCKLFGRCWKCEFIVCASFQVLLMATLTEDLWVHQLYSLFFQLFSVGIQWINGVIIKLKTKFCCYSMMIFFMHASIHSTRKIKQFSIYCLLLLTLFITINTEASYDSSGQ